MSTQPKAAHVKLIKVADIEPNPHNPRRLFDEEPMRILKESINKLGILVPVTLYEELNPRKHTRYVILDGERRWRCAKELDLPTIPAIIVDRPTDEQNILTMFHIHNVREGWQLMPTALKLQTLMTKLKETNERQLSELTKLSMPQIRRCKILLSYPKRFQDLMLSPPTERMKADFFVELQRIRGPALKDEWPVWKQRGDSDTIQVNLDKYNSEVIKAVTEFRQLAEVYRASVVQKKEKQFLRKFAEFIDTPEMPVREVEVTGATYAKEARDIGRTAKKLLAQIEATNLESISSDEDTIRILKKLMGTLKKKLDEALLTGPRDVSTIKD